MVMMKAKTSSMKVLKACHAGRGRCEHRPSGSPERTPTYPGAGAHHPLTAQRGPGDNRQEKRSECGRTLDTEAPPRAPLFSTYCTPTRAALNTPASSSSEPLVLLHRTNRKTHLNSTCPDKRVTALHSPAGVPEPRVCVRVWTWASGGGWGYALSRVSPKRNVASSRAAVTAREPASLSHHQGARG